MADARARVAQDGYTNTSIWKTAADADVDAALVMQLFRSKGELLPRVTSITRTLSLGSQGTFSGPEGGIGEHVTRAFLEVPYSWSGPGMRTVFPMIKVTSGRMSRTRMKLSVASG